MDVKMLSESETKTTIFDQLAEETDFKKYRNQHDDQATSQYGHRSIWGLRLQEQDMCNVCVQYSQPVQFQFFS